MTQLVFIVLLCWYYSGSIMVRSHFEVIEGEDETKISIDDSLQQYDKIEMNKSKFLKENRNNKFPSDFRSAYPPSVTYLLWLKNNKRFPRWVYDMVRSKSQDENLEWRINELNKLYKKCDMITGGFPLSGLYIRHLLELLNLQKRIDDQSIIEDINTKEDLDYLKSIRLPKANNSTIRLHLRDEDEILKKVDPIGYLKALAIKSPPVRDILYRKYLSISQDGSYISGDKISKSISKQKNGRLQRRNTTKRKLVHKRINDTESTGLSIINGGGYSPINKIQNIIDLIEDPGLNISLSLRKELRGVCKGYLNNYLEETYNLTNILTRYLEEKQLIDDGKYKKSSNSDLDTTIESIGIKSDSNKNKGIDIIFYDESDRNTKRKHGNMTSKQIIVDKNISAIKVKNITAGETMYSKIKFKSTAEDEKNKRNKFNRLTEFIENSKIYREIKKEFSENYLLSKYDLIDVLENVGFELSKQAKQDLTYLYGELLKNKQKSRLMEVFDEQTFSLSFPNMKQGAIIDMLTSLMLCNINNRRRKNRPKLASVLENLGFNMTKNAKKKLNKLYFAKIKANSNGSKQSDQIYT